MVNEKQSPKQAIDEFIADNLKEFLKSHGFAKRGRTWTKRHESIVYIVNIQFDRWNAVNSVPSFFVNYGIYTPLVSSNGNPSKDTTRLNNLTIGECLICERVTRRMNDTWKVYIEGRRLGLGRRHNVAGKMLTNAIEKQCLTLFDSLTTTEDIKQYLQVNGWRYQ